MTLVDQDGREHPDPHPTLTWVLRRPCGCVAAASVLNYTEARAWTELAGALAGPRAAAGYTLDRMTVAEAKALPWTIPDCRHTDVPSIFDHPLTPPAPEQVAAATDAADLMRRAAAKLERETVQGSWQATIPAWLYSASVDAEEIGPDPHATATARAILGEGP